MIQQAAASSASTPATSVVVGALGPAFAAGFAVQQLLEIVDPVVTATIGWLRLPPTAKKPIMGAISLLIGLGISIGCGIHVIQSLQSSTTAVPGDAFVSGVIISAGTEGMNSIMKFLGYAKDAKKADAATKISETPKAALSAVDSHAVTAAV